MAACKKLLGEGADEEHVVALLGDPTDQIDVCTLEQARTSSDDVEQVQWEGVVVVAATAGNGGGGSGGGE